MIKRGGETAAVREKLADREAALAAELEEAGKRRTGKEGEIVRNEREIAELKIVIGEYQVRARTWTTICLRSALACACGLHNATHV